MNLKTLTPALIAGVAIGILLLLVRLTQTVDNEVHLARLQNIRAVDALDVSLNRVVSQSTAASLGNVATARGSITSQLDKAMELLDKGPSAVRGLSPDVDKVLDTFVETIEDKFGLSFDFEMRSTMVNQRLISVMDSVPMLANQVIEAASPASRDQVQGIITQVKGEVTALGVLAAPTNAPTIKSLLDELDALASSQPQAFRDAVQALRYSSEAVMADKADMVDQVNGFLSRPTGPQLKEVEQAYMTWHAGQVAIANRYRLLLVFYAAFLLVVVGLIGWRLRGSYRDLDRANDQLKNANENLEGQVQERTKDLSNAIKDLRASEAQLIQSEKMASLGQMVAGVAHEINTPLGYARSNTRLVRKSLSSIRDLLSAQNNALTMMMNDQASDDEIGQALAEAETKRQTLNADELGSELDNLLVDANHGLTTIAELVMSLKDFSRVDRSRTDMFNANDGIESALKICQGQLRAKIDVVKNFSQLPEIECSPSQLNQVFLNIITNAAQACGDHGEIRISTEAGREGVTVRIADNGCGMPDEVKARIFEPFFTTKPVGKGTGLGLSIVYRIIQSHGGTVEVNTVPGKGTEFVIQLPLKQPRQAAASTAAPQVQAAAAG